MIGIIMPRINGQVAVDAFDRDKWRLHRGLFDFVISTLETHRPFLRPKRAADGEKLVRARIALVVAQEITIRALFFGRVAADHIQANSPLRQRGNRVDLLDETTWAK